MKLGIDVTGDEKPDIWLVGKKEVIAAIVVAFLAGVYGGPYIRPLLPF